MATATKKATSKRKPGPRKSASKKAASKKATAKTSATKKAPAKKSASKKSTFKKASTKKNKLGVKNSLVNNINKHKKKGDSKIKKSSTVDKESYKKMEDNWGKK
jgi:hypothetical protein